MADIKLPQLGESVTEGTLGKWLKKAGDSVAKYEPLVEITTDKVNAEVPSDFEGVLEEILVQEGETVRVGTVICRVREEGHGNSNDTPSPQATLRNTPAGEGSGSAGTPAIPTASDSLAQNQIPVPASARGGRFSPAVLRLAEENEVDLSQVAGTGEGGRITRKDVLAFITGSQVAYQPVETPPALLETQIQTPVEAPTLEHRPAGSHLVSDDVTVLEPSAVRKTIARKMVESKHTAPHAWTAVEADVSSLTAYRSAQKADFKRREGIDLTFMPFFIKAVVEGLKQYPMLNASWVDDQILVKRRIHISIAVATDDALAVPVIHDADRLSIAGLAHAVNELAAKARSGRLTLRDVEGGTFTVNNTGAFGSILSQPIINGGQAAILSFESIVKRPVVVNDAIAIRSMLNLSLSLDHRLLDGWVAGQFLKVVRERLESYGPETVLY